MSAAALPFGLTEAVLAAAMAEPDPDSLAAATRLRRLADPAVAAAALQQAALRRSAVTKFGADAAGMFFTRAGLEQASRPVVADQHAARLAAAGVRRVVDLGCGIGTDALAFARAGLEVVAIERDADTAAVAAANLRDRAEVVCADAEVVAAGLLGPGVAAFADPARRTSAGRVWSVADFTPGWDFVTGLLDGRRPAGVKLGPALPHDRIPDTAEAEWVTDRGSTVEVALWAGPGATPGRRSALVHADDRWHRLVTDPDAPVLPVRDIGRYVFEPIGAVIRSGGIAQLGRTLDAGLLHPRIAYLTGDRFVSTPFASILEVREQLPFDRKVLRRWVTDHRVGRLEILERGTTVDPAQLRRELRLKGPNATTLIIARAPMGTVVLVARRTDH